MEEKEKQLITDALRKIENNKGFEKQRWKAVEELGELITALTHYDGRCPKEHLIEEMADVQIMLWQMEHFLECGEEIKLMISWKVNRTLNQIGEEDK